MLHAIRQVNAALWLVLLVWLIPGIVRDLRARSIADDRAWAMAGFFAMHQLGYAARYFGGLAGPPEPGMSLNSNIGLQIMSTMIAAGLLWRRHQVRGWTL